MDSSLDLQDKLLDGKYSIVSPTPILKEKKHFILVASKKYEQEMTAELLRYGYEENKDYFCFDTRLMIALTENIINTNEGYCPICEEKTIFVETGTWLRDEYKCFKCGSIPRVRSLIRTLNRFVHEWRDKIVHESSPSHISKDFFSKRCPKYTYSEFYPNITLGTVYNGIRCENLESLTFEDNSIDVLITQDVFEHIMNPQSAFREIERVLAPGGYHIFSVPIYEHNKKSIRLAELNNNEIEYYTAPEYHGPFLVTFHYGLDIVEMIGSGSLTTIMLERDRYYGIDGEFLHIFCIKKK